MKKKILAALVTSFLNASIGASVRISRFGERLVRGKRGFLRYQARYGWHA